MNDFILSYIKEDMNMNEYAKIYTQKGLNSLILNCENKINILHIERTDVGISWTDSHIRHHHNMIDDEIFETISHLKELQGALKLRKASGLR